jgi:hypothetical protein
VKFFHVLLQIYNKRKAVLKSKMRDLLTYSLKVLAPKEHEMAMVTMLRSNKFHLGMTAVLAGTLIAGCAIDPVAIAPTMKPTTGNITGCAAPPFDITSQLNLTPSQLQQLAEIRAPLRAASISRVATRNTPSAISSFHASILVSGIKRIQDNAKGVDQFLPTTLQRNSVAHSIAQLLAYKTLQTIQTFTSANSVKAFENISLEDANISDQEVRARAALLLGNPFYLVGKTDRTAVASALTDALAATKPAKLSTNDLIGKNDFEKLFDSLISPNGQNQDRIVQYESYYFNGTFVDRFGTKLTKPSLSLTVSDQEIGGALTAFLEALADDIFATPVWATSTQYTYTNKSGAAVSAAAMAAGLQVVVAQGNPPGITVGPVNGSGFRLTAKIAGTGFASAAELGVHTGSGTIADIVTTANDDTTGGSSQPVAQIDTITLGTDVNDPTPFEADDSVTEYLFGNTYYPGGTTNEPSVATFAANQNPPVVALAPLSSTGCGMTKVKADALNYLSGKAATWASGESGLLLGAFGGASAGPVFVLGKFSVGDNKTLETIVQTVLSFAAKRATFEATIPVLWTINLPPNSTVTNVIDNLIVESPATSSAPSSAPR